MPSQFSSLALVLALSVAFAAAPVRGRAADAPEGLTRTPDLVYGQAGDYALKLDLYLPTAPPPGKAGRPVVVFFHGGGWRIGDKDEVKKILAPLTAAGFAVASVNYRLSNRAIWPAQIIDGKTAVRWVRANARRYGLDPRRVGALGFSAGGHLVALLGTTEGVKSLEDRSQGSPDASSRVQAVCDVSGPVDLSIPTRSLIGKLSVHGELGGSAAEKPDLVRQADPSLYVKGGEPPFLIIQGQQDHLVILAHARRLEAALKAHGGHVTLEVVPGAGHVPVEPPQQADIVRFFQRHLK